jgi:hypothetical protein
LCKENSKQPMASPANLRSVQGPDLTSNFCNNRVTFDRSGNFSFSLPILPAKHDFYTEGAPILQGADIDAHHVRYRQQLLVMSGQDGVNIAFRRRRHSLSHVRLASDNENQRETEPRKHMGQMKISAKLQFKIDQVANV